MRTGAVMMAAIIWLAALPAEAQVPADKWVARDKLLHVAVGAALAGAAYGGTALFADDRRPRIAAGLTLGIGASGWKEWRDRRTGGDPSWKDFTAGVLGAFTGSTVAWLIDRSVSQPQRHLAAAR